MNEKFVYRDDEITSDMKEIVGIDAIELIEVEKMGLNIPKGFVISTEVYEKYINNNEISEDIQKEIFDNVSELERKTGKKFGDMENPLFLSVNISFNKDNYRVISAERMISVENVGINKTFVLKETDSLFRWECYRLFLQDYIWLTDELERKIHTDLFNEFMPENMYLLTSDELNEMKLDKNKEIAERLKEVYEEETSRKIPEDAHNQLIETIKRLYIEAKGMLIEHPNDGTKVAIRVEETKFGNLNENSGELSFTTRNEKTGEKKLSGFFCIGKQKFDKFSIFFSGNYQNIEEINPMIYQKIMCFAELFEKKYKEVQHLNFIVENGEIYFKSRRDELLKSDAILKVYNDFVIEGILTKQEVLEKLKEKDLMDLVEKKPDLRKSNLKKITRGLKKKGGSFSGPIVFSYDEGKKMFETQKKKSILIYNRNLNNITEEIVTINSLLKVFGGMIIIDYDNEFIRINYFDENDEICIIGLNKNVILNSEEKYIKINKKIYKEGDFLTIDGNKGILYEGNSAIKYIPRKGLEAIWEWNKEYAILKFPSEIIKLFENNKSNESIMLDPIAKPEKETFFRRLIKIFKNS